MKTKWKKNKKFLATALAVIASLSCLFGIWTVVYAQEQRASDIHTSDKAVQTEVEVNVKYIFEDEKVFKEEKIKAEIGQLLDSGDLPKLSDDMKFIDEFLFYEVKGDGKYEIIRKVAKIEVKDKETQTQEEKPKQDESTQTEKKTEDKGTQTELTKDDISKMEKESKELQEKLDKLNSEIKDKDKLSDKQKEKIKDLEEEIEKLKKNLEKSKEEKDLSAEMKKEMDKLTEKIKELEKKTNEVNKAPFTDNPVVTPISPISGIKTGSLPQTSVRDIGKSSSPQDSTGKTTKDTNISNTKEKEKEVRYPNKLTPKAPANNSSQDSSMDGTSKTVNTNKGVATASSKARASVVGNKDNANKDYPIHHNDDKDKKETDKYSADARQFVTFQTKSGKTFHLIINHDEQSENVMLLTEVSEDDLLNMVEKKETPKEEVKKIEETTPESEVKKEEPKKEESRGSGSYIFLGIIVLAVVGAGYYFKIYKKKQEADDYDEDEEEYDEFEDEYEKEDDTEDLEEKEQQNIDDMAIDSYDEEDEE